MAHGRAGSRADGAAAGSRAVRAPAWPASAALAAATASVLLVAVDLAAADTPTAFRAAVAGYLLGAVAAGVLVQVHRILRRRAGASPWYNPAAALERAATLAVVLGLTSGAWHAFVVATELAK
ncbi:hypothetical protein [Georgenia thermotolerans]|uniref:hypothetical protein n=1 Tax=Georgenia thermotolerans TaxID=527326 RepID=UPI00147870DF|nr:hypothetical protein [Georgenia thermotolerans]